MKPFLNILNPRHLPLEAAKSSLKALARRPLSHTSPCKAGRWKQRRDDERNNKAGWWSHDDRKNKAGWWSKSYDDSKKKAGWWNKKQNQQGSGWPSSSSSGGGGTPAALQPLTADVITAKSQGMAEVLTALKQLF